MGARSRLGVLHGYHTAPVSGLPLVSGRISKNRTPADWAGMAAKPSATQTNIANSRISAPEYDVYPLRGKRLSLWKVSKVRRHVACLLSAHFLRSRRCSDSVCFLRIFCRVDRIVGRRTLDPQRNCDAPFPLRPVLVI